MVLRPLVELTKNNGERIIVKHKQEAFSERATPQKVIDPNKLQVLQEANSIAQEWVVQHRLIHVLSKLEVNEQVLDMTAVPKVIKAMIEDVYREGKGEIVESKDVQAAIGKRTAQMFKEHLNNQMRKTAENQ